MRHASLLKGDKPNAAPEELILILPVGEARLLVEMIGAAAASQPRKSTWGRLAKHLESLECW